MGKPQQSKAALALRAASPCARWTAKIHQTGLLRMQAQTVFGESLRQYRQHPPRILFPLEDQRRVIRKTDLKRPSPKPWLDFVLKPHIEHVMQIEVTEQRGNYAAYNCA